ncbi:hypothetical protein HAX54_015699 [Datura stramonium]|uniref:Uncharacterized protein n=1 Tax=Datura stramonium TaxID=4076 RepID=A0ABS8UJ13_DATST|nr:hypothetical protein [Datura stramonium]
MDQEVKGKFIHHQILGLGGNMDRSQLKDHLIPGDIIDAVAPKGVPPENKSSVAAWTPPCSSLPIAPSTTTKFWPPPPPPPNTTLLPLLLLRPPVHPPPLPAPPETTTLRLRTPTPPYLANRLRKNRIYLLINTTMDSRSSPVS